MAPLSAATPPGFRETGTMGRVPGADWFNIAHRPVNWWRSRPPAVMAQSALASVHTGLSWIPTPAMGLLPWPPASCALQHFAHGTCLYACARSLVVFKPFTSRFQRHIPCALPGKHASQWTFVSSKVSCNRLHLWCMIHWASMHTHRAHRALSAPAWSLCMQSLIRQPRLQGSDNHCADMFAQGAQCS